MGVGDQGLCKVRDLEENRRKQSKGGGGKFLTVGRRRGREKTNGR